MVTRHSRATEEGLKRECIKTDNPLDDKHVAISEVVKSSKNLREEFFFESKPIEQQTLKWILSLYKIPMVDKLYESGFNTPTKIQGLTKEDLEKISGFGAAKIEQFQTSVISLKNA